MDLSLEKKVFHNNIKIISFNTVILALAYIGAVFLMINKNNLSQDTVIFVGELLLSPLEIVMFVRTTLIEYDNRTYEIAYSKVYPYWRTVLYRIIIISLQLILVLSFAFTILKLAGADFRMINILLGSFITSFYLGVIAMVLGYMTKEISVGALIPFIYYFFEMFTRGRYTKSFYLFGMSEGNYMSKIKLFSIAIILVLLIMFIIKKESKKIII